MPHKRTALLAIATIGIAIGSFAILNRPVDAPSESINMVNESSEPEITEPLSPTADAFDKSKYSIDEPGSLWQVVNKSRPLPPDYVPSDLIVPDVRLRLSASEQQMKFRQIAEEDLIKMFDAASEQGVTLVFGSGYRSYSLQKQFYDSYVARDGQEAADRYSARPGTSEHQTGLSFDVTSISGKCHLEICFADMKEGQWVRNHAYEYGFIIRYPEGKKQITGYQYEPWHLRYVGRELASEIQKSSQTLEEFFGLN